MPAIYHEGSWLGNATDPEVLVKDTVGWTGKNRAYSQTNNAVIAHIESGITYDVSWTGSATVTLKKNSSSGATITSGSTSPLSFTADADYELYFGSSATVTNIMVKDSRITDPTYEPYHESVQNQLNAQGVLGAKNLLNIPDKTLTSEGVTVSINNGVASFSGTNALTSSALWIAASGINIPKGTYIFNGLDTTQNVVTNLQLLRSDNTEIVTTNVSNPSETVTIPNDLSNCKVHFRIIANGNTNGIKAYPMLRLASDPDDTYVPYAMTNRELTEVKDVTVTAGANVTVHANTNISKVGKIVSGSLRLEFTSALTVQQVLATLSDKPVKDTYAIGIESQTNKTMPIIILSNGKVLLFGSNLPTDTNNHLIIPVNFITA